MPTPRKSLSQLAASGTLSKHRGRYTARIAAQPTVIHPPGRAPGHLNEAERAVWAEVLRTAPPGLLMRSDRLALEILVRLIIRTRNTDAKTSEITALVALLGKFGMTPADRLRMNIERFPEPEELAAKASVWAQFDELDELD